MNPARLAERHGRAVILVTALVAVAGAVALLSLPSDIYPRLQFPRIIAIARSGTAPTRSMALTVTRPLEQALMEVPGIRRVRSKTFRGTAEIAAQFDPGTDMAIALQQAQSRIEEARPSLPGETALTVERLTPATFPVYILNLTGGLPAADLRDYAYYVIRPELARVAGVGRIEVMASDVREIEVVADPAKLLAAGLTVQDVSAALRASNRLAPVGRYAEGGLQRLVLVSGLWSSIGEIERTPVAVRAGATIRVGDLAQVFPGAADRTTLVAGNGQDAASIAVSQQPGGNILKVKEGIEQAVSDLARDLPSGLRLSKVYDLAEFVATAIANVRDAILIGGILAVLVLIAFLRDWRITIIAAITLPITVLATFLFMKLSGESINLMSMGGLAVAIGLVIDDAVVVVENIHRKMRPGADPGRVVEEATGELVAPVVGSTLTTVVVLIPLGLLSGVAGQFFRSLSFTLSVAVIISLVLSLTLIPILARAATRRTRGEKSPESGVLRTGLYAGTLGVMMRRPVLSVAASIGLGLVGSLLFFLVPSGFLPSMDEGGFVIDYATPAGTALPATDAAVRRIEAIVAATPEVAAFSRRTGSELGMFATQQNRGDILVRLKGRSHRSRGASQIIDELRGRIHETVPGIDVEFVQILQDAIGDLEGTPTPIEVKIFGDDPTVLEKAAEEIMPRIAEVRGVVDLVGPQRGNPEIVWEVDAAAAGRAGLTTEQVASQVAASWLGEIATELRLLDRSVPVRVRYPDQDRLDPLRLGRTLIRGADGRLIPLDGLARASESNGQAVLSRENLRQMALITARLEERDLGSAVKELHSRLRDVRLPVGYSVEIGGQEQSQRQAFRELLMVLAIAASLVLVVLVVEFRAFVPAMILIAAAPLSFGGAFLLLWLTGTELNVSSAMGLILLVGLVVKNGIVLLDYAHRLHEGGAPFTEAVVAAAQVRLRPILMTTLCTLFGLLPLAFGIGAGAELQQPLALAVVGGLGFSTLVTLYAVPSVYAAMHGLRGRGSRERAR